MTTGTGTCVEVIRDVAAWDEIGPAWDALFATSPTAAPPLSRDWMRTWWRIYGSARGVRDGELRIVTIRRDDRLIGVLPLYLQAAGPRTLGVRRLGFLSTGEPRHEATWPDYLDLLHAPGEADACLDAALPALLEAGPRRWDVLDLREIHAESPLLSWASRRPEGLGVATSDRGSCPIAELGGGFDAYLGRLSANSRQRARRLLRAAESSGFRLEVAEAADEADRAFDQLVELHQARWSSAGKPGCFRAPRFAEFHRTLAGLWVPDRRAVLAGLGDDRGRVAVLYGFLHGSKFHLYQSGIALDGAGRLRTPGITAHLALIRYLADRGCTHYDFLRGDADYKDRLATTSQPLRRIRMYRPGLRSAAGELRERAISLGRGMQRALDGSSTALLARWRAG